VGDGGDIRSFWSAILSEKAKKRTSRIARVAVLKVIVVQVGQAQRSIGFTNVSVTAHHSRDR